MTTTRIPNLLCFFLLGSSAWILVNAIYAEIPLIVASLNYDYSVISKLTLCITLTSIAPILWSLWVDVLTGVDTRIITQIGIGLMLMVGTVTALCLSLTDAAFQQSTLLVVSVAGGLVGTMSAVLYFPHAATKRVETKMSAEKVTVDSTTQQSEAPQSDNTAIEQTTAMATGIASASLFMAVLAIIQQFHTSDDNNHLFSLQAYFGVVTGIFGLAILGFIGTLLPRTVEAKNQPPHSVYGDDEKQESGSHYGSIEISDIALRKRSSAAPANPPPEQPTSPLEIQDEPDPQDDAAKHDAGLHNQHQRDPFAFWKAFMRTSRRHATINGGQFLLNMLTFFLPGIVPYSIQNFEDSQRALHYLTVTQLIAQTLGTLLSGWKQSREVRMQLLLYTILWIPTVVLSFVNNTDFQQSNQLHSAIPITLNALLNLCYGYSSTTFFHLVNSDAAEAVSENTEEDHGHNDDPHVASRVLGSWNQLGAMTGSLVAHLLVQHGAIS